MKHAIALLLLFGCGRLSLQEHCEKTCRFYSECTPEIAPLEPKCIEDCTERFADPMVIVADCARPDPRSPADQYRNLPSVQASVIDAGGCTRDRGCPSEMMTADPCEGIEQVCLDGLTEQQICSRSYEVDSFECSRTYSACINGGGDQTVCSTNVQTCYQHASERFQACS